MENQYISFNYPDETARIQHTVGYINEQIESGRGARLVEEGEAWHNPAGDTCRAARRTVVERKDQYFTPIVPATA